MKRRLALISALVVVAALWLAAAGRATPAPCPGAAGALCGTVSVPLDRADPAAGSIAIAYELYPRSDTSLPSLGTILAVPGGPGGPATTMRGEFLALFGPLLDRRDLLLVDERGTGKSGAIDCPALQHAVGSREAAVDACVAQLGTAADRYTLVDTVEDLDAVRSALGIDKLDLYGLSWGTLVGQEYALRHGEHLRSLVLDGAMPLVERTDRGNAFTHDSDLAHATADAVRLLCERSVACTSVGGDVTARFSRLATKLRARPVAGIDEADLIRATQGGSSNLNQVDGAGMALLRGDAAPMRRLVAEAPFSWGDAGDPVELSMGALDASLCNDLPTVWDRDGSPEEREAELGAALSALPSGALGPFSASAWFASGAGLVQVDCLRWPAPTGLAPILPSGASYPPTPTLVLNGDLDLRTPLEGARKVAARFPNGRLVELANVGHVTALNGACGATLTDTFISELEPGDTSCAAQPMPVFGYSLFPLRARDERGQLESHRTDRSTARDRQVVLAVVETIVDVFTHADAGRGLRGGRFDVGGTAQVPVFALHRVRFVRDVALDGNVSLDQGTLRIRGQLAIHGVVAGTLRIRLDPGSPVIEVAGKLGGRRIAVTMPVAN